MTAIPYMTKIVADYETYGLEHLAKELDWGYNQQRMKKVKSIRDIRHDAKAMVEKIKKRYTNYRTYSIYFPRYKMLLKRIIMICRL